MHLPIHRNCKLSSDHLQLLADRTVNDWDRIVRKLLLPEHEIDNIKADCKPSERAFEGYKKWRSSATKDACFCKLYVALNEVGRADLVIYMMEQISKAVTPEIQTWNNRLTSVCHFVGRQTEIDKIKDFCKLDQKEKKLLVMIGLPGAGKTETLTEALKGEDRNRIVRPQFITRGKISKLEFNDIAQCILQKWSTVIDHNLQGEVNLFNILDNSKDDVILVLEVADLNFDPNYFYGFIHELIRSTNNNLKIIITSCDHPPQVSMEKISYEIVYIRDLCKSSAIQLLKGMNPLLSDGDSENIFLRCGGNPFLLRKIAAETKSSDTNITKFLVAINSSSVRSVISQLIKKEIWIDNMLNLFHSLECDERFVLAKLVVFDGVIPEWALPDIYREEFVQEATAHLCVNHCIIDKIYVNYFHMSELIKTFLMDYLNRNKEKTLYSVYLNSKVRVNEYYLDLFKSLMKLYISRSQCPFNGICDAFFKDYRNRCTVCVKDNCLCCNAVVCRDVFMRNRKMFLQALLDGVKSTTNRDAAIKVITRSTQFLRYVLSHEDIVDLFQKFHSHCSSASHIQQAVMCANMVFIKIHKGFRDEVSQYIKMLDKSITCLQGEWETLLSYTKECLLACYCKRAFLKGIYLNDYPGAKKDLKCVFKLHQTKPLDEQISSNGVWADICFHNGEYADAFEARQKQVDVLRKQFGTHPFTVNALFLLGKCLEKCVSLDETSGGNKEVIKIYQKALQMHRKLHIYGYEYAKCLVACGKLLKQRKDRSERGNKLLQNAKVIVNNLYKQSTAAKSSSTLLYQCLYNKVLDALDEESHELERTMFKNEKKLVKYQFKELNSYKPRVKKEKINFDAGSSKTSCSCITIVILVLIIFILLINIVVGRTLIQCITT